MKLKANRDKTQAENFLQKFGNTKSFRMESTPLGEIISIDTKDKEIIEYMKKLGLTKDE